MITHRCRGSLKAGISIRYGKGWFEGNAWRMWKPITDSEWGTTVLTPITEIQFCPFCGQKLEAPEEETSDKGENERCAIQSADRRRLKRYKAESEDKE